MASRARPNVVDSSARLEYFANAPGAGNFAAAIEAVDRLVVPSVCVLEVFKVVLRQRGENDALQAAALMQQDEDFDGLPDVRYFPKPGKSRDACSRRRSNVALKLTSAPIIADSRLASTNTGRW